MINKKIAFSTMSILSALALMGGATFAFFTNAGTSSNNIFASGTLDLQLDDEDEQFTDSVTGSIGGENMAPGDSVNGFISLHNNGSIDIGEVLFGATKTGFVDNGGGNLEDVLNLTIGTDSASNCESPDDLTTTIDTAIGGGDGTLTLAEIIASDYDALVGLTAPVSAGDTYFLCMDAELDGDAGNIYQGDSVTVSFDFTAKQ